MKSPVLSIDLTAWKSRGGPNGDEFSVARLDGQKIARIGALAIAVKEFMGDMSDHLSVIKVVPRLGGGGGTDAVIEYLSVKLILEGFAFDVKIESEVSVGLRELSEEVPIEPVVERIRSELNKQVMYLQRRYGSALQSIARFMDQQH